MTGGKALPIPKLLGIPWWWLFGAGLAEYGLRYLSHAPDWLPSITGLWWVIQALWLRAAEPKSKAIFFYAIAEVLGFGVGFLPSRLQNHWSVTLLDLAIGVLNIVAIFMFRSEMEMHFNTTEPRGLVLSGVMTFFFSVIYFQYWFHDLYEQQNDPSSVLAAVVER